MWGSWGAQNTSVSEKFGQSNRKKQPEDGFGVLITKDALASGSRGYVWGIRNKDQVMRVDLGVGTLVERFWEWGWGTLCRFLGEQQIMGMDWVC